MGAVREGRLQLLPGHMDVLLRAIDVIRALMRRRSLPYWGASDNALPPHCRSRSNLGQAQSPADETPEAVPLMSEAVAVEDVSESVGVESAKGVEGKSGEEREVIRVSRDRLERLLNLVGELVIDRGRLEQRLRTLDQLASQVAANKVV